MEFLNIFFTLCSINREQCAYFTNKPDAALGGKLKKKKPAESSAMTRAHFAC